ncbi:HAD family hydrolase [Streptomyces sp. NPDC001530]|uniref:HAD family hydrolase n=1 Tax=Streptomyces sp. NPDC001530 TaxID=3364582 RepID=UPI003678E2EC
MVQRPLGNHHHGPDTLLVTSETATQTDPVAKETESLRELIKSARFVLFDFDGPICRLFAGLPAQRVARELVQWLEDLGLRELLTEEERVHPDPHVVVQAVNRRHPDSDLVMELEERLTLLELKAAATAYPTPYADPLIRTWAAVGSRLAITTNNSPLVAAQYLESRGLTECFAPHVYGRTQNLALMKPNPYCLTRALNAMGAAPSEALMIGDAPSDFDAAEAAGVPFLGYARNERKERELRASGATHTVSSLDTVLGLLRSEG